MSQLDSASCMTIDEIMSRMRSNWMPDAGEESADVACALGRVPARDVCSEIDIPVQRGAECDGIAVRSSDFAGGMPDTSRWVCGEDYAMADMGDDFDDRFDAVIPIEEADLSGGALALSGNVSAAPGRCVEPKGGTVRKGMLMAGHGQRLLSVDIANLTTAGIRRIDVLRRPRVAFIPTGKELVAPGGHPSRGQVIDCNSAMTASLLGAFGAEAVMFPIMRDVKSDLEGVLNSAMDSCDIILINGGASKGTEDFCPKLIARDASFFSHYVKARPGRPIAAAIKNGKPVVNIPGPAFSTFFPLQWCVRGLIEHWFGLRGDLRPKITAQAKNGLRLDCLPLEYGLFFQVWTEGGQTYAAALDERIRGELFMKANAYAILPIGSRGFQPGDVLDLHPIE